MPASNKIPSRNEKSPMRLTMKAFLAALAAAGLLEPEPDQQIRAEPHAFPADIQQQEVVGEHEQQHRGREEVQVGEEARVARVALHVTDRVDVDQRADAGYDQHHHDGELVHQEIDALASKLPTEIQSKSFDVALRASCSAPNRSKNEMTPRTNDAPIAADATTPAHRPMLASREQEHERSGERHGDDPARQLCVSCAGFRSHDHLVTISRGSRRRHSPNPFCRAINKMIASPTTTSAAATTRTKNTSTWPST